MRLTTKSIKAFSYRGGWDVRWDGVVTGLGLRIYSSGKRSFVLSYRHKRRKRFMVLGQFGVDMTLDQARNDARDKLVLVRTGVDPLELRRTEGRGSNFGDLIEDFLTKHVEAQGLKTAPAIRRRLERNIPTSWKSREADAIEAWEIEELHQEIGSTRPYEANRTFEHLKTMFRHARRWKYLDAAAANPTDGIKKFREHKRKRWVTPEEMKPLAESVDREPNVYVRAAIWLYLLTGMRKTELLRAKWDDVDWERGRLTLPDTKSGDEQSAALSAAALAVLQAIPRLSDNPHVLPGAKAGHHLVNVEKPWHRIRKAAGIEDVTLHDLRRTTGSWLSQGGVDLNTIKDALRHAHISTTLGYAQLGSDPAREAMEAHGRRILEAAGKRGPVEVVGGGGAKR